MSTDAIANSRFDLSNLETFKGETLTWAEAQGRQKVLAAKKRVELSPRTTAELDRLERVLDPSRVMIGPVQVEGRYSVVVHADLKEQMRAVNETAEKLQAMQRAFPNNSEVEILRVLTSSSEDMAWYRGLYEKSSETTQDFRNFSEAKLHLLTALRLLPQDTYLSKSVKQLHEQLCALHQRWIEENKNCAASELSEAKRCLKILDEVYKLFLNHNIIDQKKHSDFSIVFVRHIQPLILYTQRELFIQDFHFEVGRLSTSLEALLWASDPKMIGATLHLDKAIGLLKPIESNLFQLQTKQAHAEGLEEIEKLQSFGLPMNLRVSAAANYFGLLLKRAVNHQLNAVVAQRESKMFERIRKEEQALESENSMALLKEFEAYQSENGLISRNKVTLESLLDQRIKEMQ